MYSKVYLLAGCLTVAGEGGWKGPDKIPKER